MIAQPVLPQSASCTLKKKDWQELVHLMSLVLDKFEVFGE
jgi:hypothetical protein